MKSELPLNILKYQDTYDRSTAIEIAFVEPENAVRHTRGREYNERGRNRLILPSEIIPTL